MIWQTLFLSKENKEAASEQVFLYRNFPFSSYKTGGSSVSAAKCSQAALLMYVPLPALDIE